MASERLISADSHVHLSQRAVKEHLAPQHHAAYDDAVRTFVEKVMGQGPGQANAMGARMNYTHPAHGRKGHADPHERLSDMDTDGVDAEVLYCEVSAFRYLYLVEGAWREATRAFNDALHAFGSVDPKRLVVSYQIPIHDIDFAVQEVHRVAALGAKSLQLPVFPAELGFPDYFHDRYDPLWAAITETGMPICCHIGLNTGLADLTRRDPTPHKAVMVPVTGLMTSEALGMWLLTGVLERFPDLKVVFVEPGLGWIAWYLSIVDDMVLRQGYELPGLRELPSWYFHRNVFVTYIEEPDAIQRLRDRIGVENILWSSDYPHPVSSWPESRAIVDRQFVGVPDAERDLIVGGNAARVWNL